MRNRKVQREMRRNYGKEEKLDLIDSFGIKDPTPYEAVMNLIRQEREDRAERRVLAAARARAAVAAREAAMEV